MKYSTAAIISHFLVTLYPSTVNTRAIKDEALVERQDLTLALKIPDNGPATDDGPVSHGPAPDGSTPGSKRDIGSVALVEHQDTSGSGSDPNDAAPVKRDTGFARAINKCPDQAPGASSHYTDFQGSQCRPDSPQAWTIRCSSDDGMSISVQNFQGSCNPNEVCVDHVTSPNHPSAAYCVSQIPTLRMASAQYNGQLRDVRITPNYKIGNNYLMGAILSGQSGITAAFTTSHIIFEAQDSNRKTLPGGTADCDSCQRIGLEAVPQGTSSFLATVTLPKSDDVAILYAAGITGGTGF